MKLCYTLSSIFSAVILLASVVTLNAQTTTVKGKLLDVFGKPSQYAQVGILEEGVEFGKDFVNCDEKGNYKIKLTKPGVNILLFSMPSHNFLEVPVDNNRDKEFNIDVTLAPYKYKDNFDAVYIAGNFNNYNIRSPEKMIKKDDGTFVFELETDLKELTYCLCGIEKHGRTVNAPDSYGYEADFTGDYRSILPVKNNKAVVVFDPLKLLKKDVEYKISFSGSEYDGKIFKIYKDYDSISSDAYSKMREYAEAGKNPVNFKYDGGSWFGDLPEKIETEKDNDIKNCLKMAYLAFIETNPIGYDYKKASLFFESVSPDNAAWELFPMAFFSYTKLFPSYKWDELEESFLNKSASTSLKINILENKLYMAKSGGDEENYKKIRSMIENKFGNNESIKELLNRYPAETKIRVGADVPDFEVVSLDNEKVKFTKQSMLGKIYLIDFWATWCAPCVNEMNFLHKAYEKYKDKGFEILSLSIDGKKDDVINFRKYKWKMPWKNSFIGPSSPLPSTFEAIGVPRPVLISKEGKILAVDMDIRGEKLEETLEKFMGGSQ
ncbi:MAG TPA: TlpA disulfide reductase family protein [Ignavibacteriaceae bacterium]|nr:TlpA disulfide reductase family protein [Ignavibacteriaceae bacterium]